MNGSQAAKLPAKPVDITHLPNELLAKILRELDLTTTQSLFQIKELRNKLKVHMDIVVYSKSKFHDYFHSIPLSIIHESKRFNPLNSTSWITHYCLPIYKFFHGVARLHVEQDYRHYKILTLASGLSSLSYHPLEYKLVAEFFQQVYAKVVNWPLLQKMTFKNITEVELLYQDLDFKLLEFPDALQIKFLNCTLVDNILDWEVQFPKLQELSLIDDGAEDILSCVDFTSSPLKRLYMESLDQRIVIKDLVFGYKTSDLSIETHHRNYRLTTAGGLSITKLENIFMPNVRELIVDQIFEIQNIDAPQLEVFEMSLKYEHLGFVRRVKLGKINAPNIEVFSFSNGVMEIDQNFTDNIPIIDRFRITNGKVGLERSCNENLKAKSIEIYIQQGAFETFDAEDWFESINLYTVEGLTFFIKLETKKPALVTNLNRLEFPKLKSLYFPDCSKFVSVPEVQAPSLETLRIAHANLSFRNFKRMVETFNNLKNLELKGVIFNNGSRNPLTYSPMDRNDPRLGFKNCSLPNLQRFRMSSDMDESIRPGFGFQNLYAPNLKKIDITFPALKCINLNEFPLLEDVKIDGPQYIDLEQLKNLKSVLIQSDVLIELKLNEEMFLFPDQLTAFHVRCFPEKNADAIIKLFKEKNRYRRFKF